MTSISLLLNIYGHRKVLKKKRTEQLFKPITSTYEEPKTKAKTRTITRSTGYILPLFNRHSKYKSLCNKRQLDGGIVFINNEFESRGLFDKFNHIAQNKTRIITSCQDALVQHERLRFEKELDVMLS